VKKEDFKKVLVPVHGTFWQKAYKKLLRKISTLKSSLKRRSIESDVVFDMELIQLKQMFLACYGKKCRYCTKVLTYRNIACDHIIPLTKGGDSTEENLQLICKTCNTRKGPLDEKDFNLLVDLVLELPEELSTYVMRKLAKGGRY
tara:strand:+ start:2036 stop:2470 length:435 start_codon:yes stop_codon:yes gene_type:complete